MGLAVIGLAAIPQHAVSPHCQFNRLIQGLGVLQLHMDLHLWLETIDKVMDTIGLIDVGQLQHTGSVVLGIGIDAASLLQGVKLLPGRFSWGYGGELAD